MEEVFYFIQTHWVSITGTLIGLLFLYFEYKANVWMWPVSILMAAFYTYIFYSTRLYASMGIYIYFFLASVYGWLAWVLRNRDKETGKEIITRVGKKYISVIPVAVLLITFLIYLILKQFTTNPIGLMIGDSLTTSLNIVALWMLSRKWAEQWLLIIPANAILSVLLFLQKDAISGILFGVFFVVSILGYYKWKQMAIARQREIT